ncbi:hypothetical protein PRZ48_008473 [Zasmidium cellare]|uniref:Xylanolytic transcriptional activator regulatory domain-containing protein n=1 Tax=Zasmidium cellare TaxID=395010 RepID=A0ABR0EFJ1_ZASCE|nr:hypothetical protein PRZ48_008473 [Zasmidium cellare]
MALVESAFRYDDSPADDNVHGPLRSVHVKHNSKPQNPQTVRALLKRLRLVLPTDETIDLLVKTYFDRVHWFVLAFHQDDFKHRLQVYLNDRDTLLMTRLETTGYLSTLLAVLCVGLECLGPYRTSLLEQQCAKRNALQEQIETVLNESFLDIISLATIESAQTCVLLSVYYLYRGNVQKAWPICACALRIAQTLELHRPPSADRAHHLPPTQSFPVHILETRKRCWWAIYEVETFCCMLYGYTPAICDADCSVDFLDDSLVPARLGPNLLTYKKLMCQLSVIIKQTLQAVYRRQGSQNGNVTKSNELQFIVAEVQALHTKLEEWQSNLPPHLRITTPTETGYSSLDEAEHDIGASGEQFAQHATQLQALTLKLAFDNTRILIHRRLLSFDFSSHFPSSSTTPSQMTTTFHHCLSTCREAGSQTAELGALPIFKFAAHTYAAAFINTHLFTAGVALCLSAMIDPLSEHNTSVKRDVQKIIKLQKGSSAEVLPSPQALSVLQRLMRVVLEKELACIVNPGMGGADQTIQPQTPAGGDRPLATPYPPSPLPSNIKGSSNLQSTNSELPSTMFNNLQGFEDSMYPSPLSSALHH